MSNGDPLKIALYSGVHRNVVSMLIESKVRGKQGGSHREYLDRS
ncbi:hypothetical protein PITC_079700 [Penicillium italicum]|uniref:Uncharacterized protein n=1 Tax=Penicillium italicum TaxID=40296 RepID=A0A0A2KI36_PENIT|nr:hypothetical protein PITC_079700 [Penicillium italicum]